jgi:hypothetical protein
MNIWLLERRGKTGYDEVEGFIVIADTEEEARRYASQKPGDEGKNVWLNSLLSHCMLVTSAWPNGVLIRSFRAG